MSDDRVLNNPVLMARKVQQELKQARAKLVYASIDPSDGSRRMIPEPAAIAEDAIIETSDDANVNEETDK